MQDEFFCYALIRIFPLSYLTSSDMLLPATAGEMRLTPSQSWFPKCLLRAQVFFFPQWVNPTEANLNGEHSSRRERFPAPGAAGGQARAAFLARRLVPARRLRGAPDARGSGAPPGRAPAPRCPPAPLAPRRPAEPQRGGECERGGLGVCPALLLPARGTGVSSPLPAAAAHSAGRPAAGRVGCPGAMARESLPLLLLLAALGSRGQSPSPPPPPQRGTGERGARASPARPGPRRGRRPPRHQLGNPCGDGRDEGTGTESDK